MDFFKKNEKIINVFSKILWALISIIIILSISLSFVFSKYLILVILIAIGLTLPFSIFIGIFIIKKDWEERLLNKMKYFSCVFMILIIGIIPVLWLYDLD